MEQALMPISDAARILGIGKTTVYELIKRGELHKVKIGTKTARIPRTEIERYVARLANTPGGRV